MASNGPRRPSFRRQQLTAVFTLLAALAAGACARHPPAPTPLQLSDGSPAGPSPVSSLSISGTVWVYGPTGPEPARRGLVFGWLQGRSSGRTTGPVSIDSNGRYEFSVPHGLTRVSVERGIDGQQPCAVTLEPTTDVTADLFVVTDARWLGAGLPAELLAQTPTLSGLVYETTPEGRRPVPNAWVWLDGLYGLGQLVADTRTDADGRYVLCAVPRFPGMVIQVSTDGFQMFESTGDLVGVETLDIELRRTTGSDEW